MSAGRPGDAMFSYGIARRLLPNDPSIEDALARATAAFDKEKRSNHLVFNSLMFPCL